MDRRLTKKFKKPLDDSEYYKAKEIRQRQKLTYFLARAITFRAAVIFFILFDLMFSYWYSFKAGWILSSILLCINSLYLVIELLIIKKKIPKIRNVFQRLKMYYLDVL